MSKEQPLVTLPLFDLVKSIIGDDISGVANAPVSREMGIILNEFLKPFSATAVVAFTDFDGQPLPEPLLWNGRLYREYRRVHETQRVYKHNQRVKWDIEQANVRHMSDVLVKKGMPDERAKALAYRLVRAGNVELMRVLGMTRWVENEEQLNNLP